MRKLKAQQITEFMLAAPLLIMFFVVLTEYAFAFNSNIVFTNALKSSISAYINLIDTDKTTADYQEAITNYVRTDMQNNRIPNVASLNVNLINVNNTPVVIGSYTYRPGFTFVFLPALREIRMQSASVFSIPIQNFNGYQTGISTAQLNLLGAAPAGEP
ncbi:hypothetical protein IJE86_02215 [bacterium]|nr:hypothetical protein [bacterium]